MFAVVFDPYIMTRMKVILTEKPSVARDIAKVLKANQKSEGFLYGNGLAITWAYGHLIQLAYPETYDKKLEQWKLQDLPIIPDTFITELIPTESSKKQFGVIQKLMTNKDLTEVVCATDAGREGELIFRYIYEKTGCTAPIRRLWISSQTDQAILEGFKTLKPGTQYEPLYASAASRTEADWLIGMNASRAYTIRFSKGNGVMSVGRVQTPVLNMIVTRFLENQNFKPQTFYEIEADITHAKGSYKGKWFQKKEDRFFEKSEAETILNEIQKNPEGQIFSVTKKEKKEQPPLLYDLTELQKEANRQFKFSADHTLQVMQNLYEKHKILSYPRTSSRYLSTDIVPKLPGLLKNLQHIPDYQPFVDHLSKDKLKPGKRVVDDKKVTDHHAIIPTDKKPNLAELNADEKKIYDLVIRRFLSVFYPDCVKDHTEIISTFGSHTFKTTGTIMRKPGWRQLYLQNTDTEDKPEDSETLLPPVSKGDSVHLKKAHLKEGQTKAPPLHNEASILGAMETAGKQIEDEDLREAMKACGLGTPATRAQILERLIKVGYILRDKNKLIPTEKGIYLISSIQDKELLSAELTGQWEKKLNDMAQGHYARQTFLEEIKAFTEKIVTHVGGGTATLSNPSTGKTHGTCPLCQKGTIQENKLSLGCSDWKSTQCPFTIWKTIAGKTLSEEDLQSLLKTGKTPVLDGFKSKAGKPFKAGLILKDGKVQFQF